MYRAEKPILATMHVGDFLGGKLLVPYLFLRSSDAAISIVRKEQCTKCLLPRKRVMSGVPDDGHRTRVKLLDTCLQIPAMYGGIGYQAGPSPAMPMVQA